MKTWRIILVFGFLVVAAPAFAQDAVVKIYGDRPGQDSGQGTGFFSSNSGQIVTAYHVVEGAIEIKVVHDRLGPFTNIQVEFIAPEFDLAVLRILNDGVKTPSLQLDNNPDLTNPLEVSGFPRGGVLQTFRGRATQTKFVDSHTIRDTRGRRLFEGQIDVIPLDMSIYTGISGAPVVGSRGVIGVLSGSYDEGGGIGWAIPLKYLQKLTQIRRRPSEIHWPRLTLMATAWRNLRTSIRLNAEANQIFEQYMEDVETMARILDELYEQASTVRLNFLAHRPFLRRVISDPTLSTDWEAANRLLEPTGSQAFRSLRRFNNLSSEYADTGRRLAVNLAKVNTWIRNESGLDDRRGRALGQELRDVRNQLADFTRGIDVYLGINTEELMAMLPALQQGL